MFAFAGPAYLVSVGYMDPGNWATDLEGGARFGYHLLWVLVMSNAMAILLQTLSARLGIVNGRDLAQACRESYPRPISWTLWLLCEIAIAACDLAEVLGAAIGLNLLFGLPLIAGVVLTAADTLLIIWFSRFGIRVLESIVLAFISVIGVCFFIEILLARPEAVEVARGLIPKLTDESLYVAIGILGATVMPHNLYLHSSLVQTRRIEDGDEAKRAACRFNLIDSVVALNGALLINAAILILAGATFFKNGIVVTEIQQAYQLLAPLLGTTLASIAFGIALLCSGQSSTITGTMAGQIVMEGFLQLRMRPWLRRLVTRLVAVTPAVCTIYFAGDQATFRLLILSQVILSLQLPFAVIPLLQFTSDRQRMGEFASRPWVQTLAWIAAVVIVGLNVRLVSTTVSEWLAAAGGWRPLLLAILIPLLSGLALLLGWITFEPWLRGRFGRKGRPSLAWPERGEAEIAPVVYREILVPVDHTPLDRIALVHALGLARTHGARLLMLHIEEGVTSRLYGELSSTAEVEEGRRYFESLADWVRRQGVEASLGVLHGVTPTQGIIAFARERRPDLIVMGAHGHKGLKDIVFGATINEVRHALGIPVLIVREPPEQ
jgi:manganese transport protein